MMNRIFMYPIEYIQIYYVKPNLEFSPYVITGVCSGLVVCGFVIKHYIVKLVRKHV